MKKGLFFVCFVTVVGMCSFAYNPAVSGDQMDRLTGAASLSSASSAAGGGIFFADSHSINVNPALTAYEQRIALNAGYTFLAANNDEFGNAFQAGFLYPWIWFVGATEVRGVLSPLSKMNLGNSIDATLGASKDITERLSVGLSIGTGYFWGASEDWKLSAGIGALYRIPYFGFLQDIRLGASILNLGKNYTSTSLIGIDKKSQADMFPGVFTVRAGVASTIFKNDFLEIGASADVSVPAFQNLIFDFGVQMSFGKGAFVSVAENLNLSEISQGYEDFLPAVSVGWRFVLNTRKNSYMASRDWQESEMRVDGGWKNLYTDVNAFSASASLKLGMIDKDAPAIELWD